MSRGKNKASRVSPLDASLNEKIETVEVKKEVVEESHNTIDVITVSMASSSSKDLDPYHNCVKFEFKYPDDFKATKYHKDGEVANISKESAQIFLDAGLGKVIY